MTDLRQLREIEKLVEDSVFHPSPRHHLKQRVLKRAIEAKHRQTLWKRFGVTSSAVSGTLVIAFVGFRLFTSGPTTTATETGPVRVQIYSPGHNLQPVAPTKRRRPPERRSARIYIFILPISKASTCRKSRGPWRDQNNQICLTTKTFRRIPIRG
jgi:hypothetical protein